MIRVVVLLCLVSVAFALPYDSSSRYLDDWVATPVQFETSQPYLQPQAQDEGSPRQTRGIDYSVQLENDQVVPQVAYVELDANIARSARSLLSGQSIDSSVPFGSLLNEQALKAQIPQVSNAPCNNLPQAEQATQNYKSFSFDTLPYTAGRINNPVFNLPSAEGSPLSDFRSSEGLLKDYVKELVESNNKPVVDSKRPRMIGFYYMNIQRFPVKQLVDEPIQLDQKPNKNKINEEPDRGQLNEDEVLRQMQLLLQRQITKFLGHQQQEHSLFQELTQPRNPKEIIFQEPDSKKVDLLGKEEKKFLIDRLHQEEHWLEDSLKHVRGFLNELQTDDNVSVASNSATSFVAGNLSNTNDGIKHVETSSVGDFSSTESSSNVSSSSESMSAVPPPPKETA